jgi:hypothetical protein
VNSLSRIPPSLAEPPPRRKPALLLCLYEFLLRAVLSGSWQPVKIESISDKALLVTYRLESDTLSMSRPSGQSYTAKLNGTDAPYKGDPDTNVVSLKRLDNNTIEETSKLNGKVVSITRLAVGSDGKSMTVSVQDVEDGTTNRFTMRKQ